MDDLRKLAEAATPGPWKFDDDAMGCRAIKGGKSGSHKQAQYTEIAYTVGLSNDERDRANAAYIAACSPDRILNLLDVVEASKHLRYCTEVLLQGTPHAGHTEATAKAVEALRTALAALEAEQKERTP